MGVFNMTRLWTTDPPEPDTELNNLLHELAELTSEVTGYQNVVFHNHNREFAPFHDTPDTLHIHLGGVPIPAKTRARYPYARPACQTRELPADKVLNIPQFPPLLQMDRCKEPTTIKSSLYHAFNRNIARIKENNIYLPIVLTDITHNNLRFAVTNLLVHVLLLHYSTYDTNIAKSYTRPYELRTPFTRLPPKVLNDKISSSENSTLIKALCAFRAKFNRTSALWSIVHDANIQPRQALLDHKRTIEFDLATARNHYHESQDSLRKLQKNVRERIQHCSPEDLVAHYRQELDNVRNLPQVRAAHIQSKTLPRTASPTRHRSTASNLVLDFAPMIMAEPNPDGDHKVIPPVRAILPMPGSSHAIEIHGPFSAPHPHVRSFTCLGSVESDLKSALQNGDLLLATTLLVGWLQTYNHEDGWGVAGKPWPTLNIAPDAGGTVILKPRADAADSHDTP